MGAAGAAGSPQNKDEPRMEAGGKDGEDYELTPRKGSEPCLAHSQLSLCIHYYITIMPFPRANKQHKH